MRKGESMIIRRVLINFIFIVMGCFFGILVAQFMKDNYHSSPALCIFAIILFLAIFIGVAQLLLPRVDRITEEIPDSIHMRHDATWGWLIPRNDTAKMRYPLTRDRTVIGRDIKNDILLNDESVSRSHVEIVRTEEGYIMRDMNSKNGLFINNQRVQEHVLCEGDAITIGDLDFLFSYSRKDAPPPPEVS